MSVFYGSKDDFIKYIGGYCRNKVLTITKQEKNKYNNICACCGIKSELQAAHVHGFERLQIIEDILNENFKEDDIYNVDLDEFERIFIEKHYPISKHFFFLCQNCHKKYDSNLIDESDIKLLPIKETEHTKVNRYISRNRNKPNNNIKYSFNGKDDLYKLESETVQNYVKRLIHILLDNNLLSNSLIEQLQNKNYCKLAFDLEYPLLEQDENKIRPAGKMRYYAKKINDKYYLCSQWWKSNFYTYEKKLKIWVEKIITMNNL